MHYGEDVKRRLRRAEGQIRGVLKMMDDDQHCKDVVSQLSAVRSAIDKTMAIIVATNLEKCIVEQRQAGQDSGKLVQEAVELLIKSR